MITCQFCIVVLKILVGCCILRFFFLKILTFVHCNHAACKTLQAHLEIVRLSQGWSHQPEPSSAFLWEWHIVDANLVVNGYIWHTVLPTLQFTRRIGLLWNRLLRVKILLGGWPKIGLLLIRLPAAALFFFFFKLASFLSFQGVFEPFQCPRTFFASISGIKMSKMSWRAINIDYPLHGEVNNLIVFPPNWVVLIVLRLKNIQIWEIGRIIAW